jgi:O-antigen ligase
VSRAVIAEPTADPTGVANPRRTLPRFVLVLAMVVVAVLATVVAFGPGFGSSATVVTLGVAGGAALALLAVNRFWWMLLALFMIRAALDNFKAGSSLAPTTLVGAVFLLSAVVWLFVQWRVGSLVPLSWSAKTLLAFAGALVISAIGASNRAASLQASSKVLSVALMLVVLEQIFATHPERLKAFLVAVFASLIIPFFVSYVAQLPHSKPQTGFNQVDVGRLNGTFAEANTFAAYLVIVALIAFALLPYFKGWWRRGLIAVIAGTTPLILFTYARGAWIAFLVGLLFIGVAQSRGLIATLLVMIVVVMLAVPSVSTRLADLAGSHSSGTTTVTKVEPNSFSWRILYWQKVFPLLGQNPITGIGPDMVERSTPEAAPPHNSFLQALVEGGILGFALFILFLVALWRDLIEGGRRLTRGLPRGVAVAAAASALALFLQLFSENILTNTAIPWYLVVCVAWTVAETRRRRLQAEALDAAAVPALPSPQ